MKHILSVLAAIAMSASYTQTIGAHIQKLSRVSKPDDGKTWTVYIYEYDQLSEKQGRLIKKSTFKKNTDGPLTKKLQFDFTNTDANLIKVVPQDGRSWYIVVTNFDPVQNLTATITDEGISFEPNVLEAMKRKQDIRETEAQERKARQLQPQLEEAAKELQKETYSVNVKVPKEPTTKWTIISGQDTLTKSILNSPTVKLYALDTIEIPEDTQLKIFRNVPTSIAVKKAEDQEYKISKIPAKQWGLYLEIQNDGRAKFINEKDFYGPIDLKATKNRLMLKSFLLRTDYPRELTYENIKKVHSLPYSLKWDMQNLLAAELPHRIQETPYYVMERDDFTRISLSDDNDPEVKLQKEFLQTVADMEEDYRNFSNTQHGPNGEALAKALLEKINAAEENKKKKIAQIKKEIEAEEQERRIFDRWDD